jgi:3'-phosphoadenosine 5'-phosphosulfate sulfotransferase (PAPS reductase)/FAD synthetase
MKKKKLLVSTSGGRTSALMAYLLWMKHREDFDMEFVFANTSREKEETLVFVDNISKKFGIPITWVEAVVNKGIRKGTTHKVVDFNSAQRDGSVFEEVIKKYGIPNASFLHCTRELKTAPIRSYLKSKGWGDFKKYTTAIGYRKDEPKRANLLKAQKLHQWYPLWEWGIKKSDVAAFWNNQSFDLGLIDADGNCKKCYKKSDAKILHQVRTEPDDNWIGMMEFKYQYHKAGREGVQPPYFFFRHRRTLNDIIDQYKDFDVKPLNDKSLNAEGSEYDFDLNEQEDCYESCEPFNE